MALQTQLSDLSSELIFDILSRLPLTTLVRAAKYTCKLWFSIVSDPFFADFHLTRSLKNPPGQLYTLYSRDSTALYFADHPTLCSQDSITNAIQLPGDLGDKYNYSSFASSLGLMTYKVGRDHSIYVCNPITGYRLKLPDSEPQLSKYPWGFGFGYAPLTDKYKYLECFSLEPNKNPLNASVFTLGEKSWLQLAVPFRRRDICSKPSDAVCCNGALYWSWELEYLPPGSEHNVISFDLDNEKFRLRRVIPSDVERSSFSQYLIKLEETISFVILTTDYIQEVWTLVDEVEDIWFQKYRLPHPEDLNLSFKLYKICANGDLYGIEGNNVEVDAPKVIKSYNANCQTCVAVQLPLPDDMDNNANYQSYGIVITHVGCLISPSNIVAATANQPILEALETN